MKILSLCIDNKTHEHVRLCAQQDIQATIIRVSPFTRLTDHILGRCGKPKFGSDSVFKNRTVQKFDIRSDGFPIETACNPPFR